MTYRRAGVDDIDRVSAFRKSYFHYNPNVRCYESQYYRWKCFQNPCREGEVCISESDGEVVGLYTFTPKKMLVRGEVMDGAEAGDEFVHPEFRRLGISTRLGQIAHEGIFEKGFKLLYNVPSNITWARDSGKMGYAELPTKILHMIKPVNVLRLFQPGQRVNRRHAAHILLSTLAGPWNGVRSLSHIRLRQPREDISVRRVEEFPGDTDRFWEKAAEGHDVGLISDRRYLTWRYLENPDTYELYVASDAQGAMAGYMVTKIAQYGRSAVGYVVDFLTLGDMEVFRTLLREALRNLRREKASYINTWALEGSDYGQELARTGFRTYNRRRVSVYQNELGKEVCSPGVKWHLTMGCSDIV